MTKPLRFISDAGDLTPFRGANFDIFAIQSSSLYFLFFLSSPFLYISQIISIVRDSNDILTVITCNFMLLSLHRDIPYYIICQFFGRVSDASEEIARLYRNSIITDGVVYAKMTNTEILKLVRAHLYAHVVRMPFGEAEQTFYTQVTFPFKLYFHPFSIYI